MTMIPVQVPSWIKVEPGSLNQGPCYVCGTLSSLEMHHMIPCAYGGTDGPQISLCAIDHALVHGASFKLGKERLPQMIVDRARELSPQQARIAIPVALYLAWVIRRSTEFTKDDPNKKVKFQATIKRETSRRLKELTDHWGLDSKTATLELLVNNTYSKLFLLNGDK